MVQPDGLLFRHVGCSLEVAPGVRHPSSNPFWNGTSVLIDDFVDVVQNRASQRVPVSHWQIDALRQVQARGGSEMWFPAALLPRVGDRRHVLVSLTGAKNVGKTYLALRALDQATYSRPPYPSDDFFYIHHGRTPGSAAEFLTMLYLRQLLRQAEPVLFEEALASTVSRPRNLKAVIFPGPPSKRYVPLIPRVLQDLYRDLVDQLHQRGQTPEASYRALLMYDLAGEAVERRDADVLRHDDEMDVLAVLVSIEDFAPRTSGTSPGIAAAVDRLSQIAAVKTRRPNVRCCLVVTKCDRSAPAQSSAPTTERLRADVLQSATDLGESMLKTSIATAGVPGALVDRLVFTWRERNGRKETVHGLEDFVRWCLG